MAVVHEPELARVSDAICAGGGQAVAIRLHVTSETVWQAAMTRILAEWGRLDISVNCAGISFAKPIIDLAIDDWRRVIQTNLDGAFLGTKHAMAAMQTSGGGCILNIASAAGFKPLAGNAACGVSKAAIRLFTQVAALEGKPHLIRVNSISPGAVATPMWRATDLWPIETEPEKGEKAALHALVMDHGFAQPEDIAAAVVSPARTGGQIPGRVYVPPFTTRSRIVLP